MTLLEYLDIYAPISFVNNVVQYQELHIVYTHDKKCDWIANNIDRVYCHPRYHCCYIVGHEDLVMFKLSSDNVLSSVKLSDIVEVNIPKRGRSDYLFARARIRFHLEWLENNFE